MAPISPAHPSVARLHDARTGWHNAWDRVSRSVSGFSRVCRCRGFCKTWWKSTGSTFFRWPTTSATCNPGLPITAFMHDVMTQKARREGQISPPCQDPHRDRPYEPTEPWRVEPRLLAEIDQIFSSRKRTLDLLRGMGVTRPVEVIDPNVQVPDEPACGSERPVVAFTGAMPRSANTESIAWFLARVSPRPRVLAEMAGATLIVGGANPPQWLWQRRSSSVVVTGYVDDFDEDGLPECFVVGSAPLTLGAGD